MTVSCDGYRLIYTASIAAMMPTTPGACEKLAD